MVLTMYLHPRSLQMQQHQDLLQSNDAALKLPQALQNVSVPNPSLPFPSLPSCTHHTRFMSMSQVCTPELTSVFFCWFVCFLHLTASAFPELVSLHILSPFLGILVRQRPESTMLANHLSGKDGAERTGKNNPGESNQEQHINPLFTQTGEKIIITKAVQVVRHKRVMTNNVMCFSCLVQGSSAIPCPCLSFFSIIAKGLIIQPQNESDKKCPFYI